MSYPLGATYDGTGTNFSIYSEVATQVELCLFDDKGQETRVPLPEVTNSCWHGYLPDVGEGQRYGYRVHGPWKPEEGQRCNPSKLLIDPYARQLSGDVEWNPAVFGYQFGNEEERSDADSAPFVPRSIVTTPLFDWGNDHPPQVPWHQTVIYEAHVKGMTAQHPEVPPELRGTYAGLAHPAVIEHLRTLGVTAIELMPVHHFVHDHHLVEKGLRNYWGYNTIGFFAPYAGYASSQRPVQEFKHLVKTLHAAGLEVILDVVYNHSAEGNHAGPTLSFKGIDNRSYYRLVPEDARYYFDYTGCGNSFNMRNPSVIQLIMDSLRYWVSEMHVDGFRFDLAATLARELHDVDRLSAFFDVIQQDPIMRRVKLIAEPWDLGENGYQVGNFPPLWTEWNARYRDTVRDYWRGAPRSIPELANSLTGSSDLYQSEGRRPHASLNFVTAHDGYSLADLVSYEGKHNEANGEDNHDGHDDNRSWNCGAEGPTDDLTIKLLRRRQQRNFLATLFLSQGVPMLCAGDELGRSQQGNNNAYCQDGPVSWLDWAAADPGLLRFARRVIALRRKHPTFRRRRFFQGRPIHGMGATDIAWLRPDGKDMTQEDWQTGFAKSFGMFLHGQGIQSKGPRGETIVDDGFLLLFNAHHEGIRFEVQHLAGHWLRVLDTAIEPEDPEHEEPADLAAGIEVAGHSMQVFRAPG